MLRVIKNLGVRKKGGGMMIILWDLEFGFFREK